MIKIFNVNAAKSGAKIVTRDGRPVRILDFSFRRGRRKIVAAIPSNHTEEGIYLFDEEGKFELDGQQSDNDLFIEEESTYRPYANAAEMDAAIKKHGMFVKHCNGKRLAIKGYDEIDVSVGAGCNYGALLEYFKWIDGTPCGVQEGGEE